MGLGSQDELRYEDMLDMNEKTRSGPLAGIKVLEVGGVGPGPFCGMLLADLGADVLRITPAGGDQWPNQVTGRGKRELTLNLKHPADNATCRRLVAAADVLIEGYRPGVMERLGLGPEPMCAANPRLIYGRMTGWGQTGPLAQAAGHDINYIALTGVLAAMGPPHDVPVPPLNLVGDFGGGSLYLAMAISAGLFWRWSSGRGQVIDAAIVDGAASLMATALGYISDPHFSPVRERNVLAGSAPHYGCYVCADGHYIALGAIEPQFYELLLRKIGVEPDVLESREDTKTWPVTRARLAEVFKTRSRAEWTALLEGTDACFAPVLELEEAKDHPHMRHRGTYLSVDGVLQPYPAPRFSATPLSVGARPVRLRYAEAALTAWNCVPDAEGG